MCLSTNYIGIAGKLKFQCAKGHTWSFSGHHVKTSWCSQCLIEAKKEKQLKSFREHANKKGGKLLSTLFKDTHSKVMWECKEGHHWLSSPHSVTSGKSWCPECGEKQRAKNRRRHTIEAIQKEAKKRGGKLLSKEYTSTEQKLHWECAKKHRWYAEWSNVLHNGAWCQKCYWERRERDEFGRYA